MGQDAMMRVPGERLGTWHRGTQRPGTRRPGTQRPGTWLACAAFVVCVVLCGLAGCALLGEPATTGDLLVRFAANPNNENYSTEGKVDLTLSCGGLRARVPIAMEAKAYGSSLHGTVDVDMTSVSGGRRAFDVYVEQQGDAVVGYVRESSGTTVPGGASAGWGRAEVNLPFKIDVAALSELLSSAKFMRVSYDSDDQVRYELTLPAQAALDVILGKGQVSTSFAEVDTAAIREALGDSRLRVRFDKNCAVRSVSLELEFSQRVGEVASVVADIDLDAALAFDGYGSVTAGEAAVPSSVRESAVNSADPFGVEVLARELGVARG